MSETPMVERAADALRERIDDWYVGNMSTPEMARLVIQAMRQPSSAMIEAGARYAEDTAHDGMGMQRSAAESLALGLFDAMIDAALAVPEEGREP